MMPEKLKGIDSLNSVRGNLFVMLIPSIQNNSDSDTVVNVSAQTA